MYNIKAGMVHSDRSCFLKIYEKFFKKSVDKTIFCGTIFKHPGVAQVVACLNGVQEAVSSSLATRTIVDIHCISEYPLFFYLLRDSNS